MLPSFRPFLSLSLAALWLGAGVASADQPAKLESKDLFDLQYASDVQISPDGERVVYQRAINDVMSDCNTLEPLDRRPATAVITEPLLSGKRQLFSSARWSPEGDRLAYVADDGKGKTQLFVRWMAQRPHGDGDQPGRVAFVDRLVARRRIHRFHHARAGREALAGRAAEEARGRRVGTKTRC
jgi:dipeptidyl aminopeptidase/acylaminoacyl peptidase